MSNTDAFYDRLNETTTKKEKVGDATTTRKIIELLKHRHPGPAWAHFVELNEGTGANGHGFMDFFAFNVWPSGGYRKIAYEVKVSRSDFARELSQPRKRESAEAFANECYFATPCGLVKPDEVPEGWGLIEMVSNGLRVKKHAQQRKVDSLPMSFVASIARRSTDEKPVLPPALWLIAGQEVGLDKLRDIASDEVQKNLSRQLYEAEQKGREKALEQSQDSLNMASLIRDRLGWGMDTKALAAWLDNQTPRLPNAMRIRLRRLSRDMEDAVKGIAAFLEKDEEEANG